MSLHELLGSGRLKRHKATGTEVRRLFGVVARDLADARAEGLSDDCRSKRNVAEYLGAEVTSAQEVAELVREARAFSELIQRIIRERHPRLAR